MLVVSTALNHRLVRHLCLTLATSTSSTGKDVCPTDWVRWIPAFAGMTEMCKDACPTE
ncbi:MAG: hypothetical protein K8S87_00635 [Planctomycetes bacterium]|nr:hypothetical protein [Planctomycetota bacterium]